MAKVSILMILPPVLFAGLAAAFYIGMARDDPDGLPSALTGKPAPAVRGTPLGDTPTFDDATLRAPGVKLVNYWASWCQPCRAEHPILEAMAAQGVPIFGVNYKDDPEKALAFLAELGSPYVGLGADVSGRMALDWGVYGVPETYVIDANGKIVLRFAGPITERALNDTIRPAMAAAGN